MPASPLQHDVRQHFVAFLDVLGFTEMVEADLLGERQENLSKLFRCHQSAAVIFRDDPSCSIIQFSDSIVVAMPYSSVRFEWFASRVADYQRLLLDVPKRRRGGSYSDRPEWSKRHQKTAPQSGSESPELKRLLTCETPVSAGISHVNTVVTSA